MDSRRRRWVGVVALTLVIGSTDFMRASDDALIPSTLPAAKRDALKTFLAEANKPQPKTGLMIAIPFLGANAVVDVGPLFAAPWQKQYLSVVIPHRETDPAAGPDKVDIYWYRPNATPKQPGVTVKQVFDFTTNKAVGNPEVMKNFNAPLTREEEDIAVKLARADDPAVKALYGPAPGGDADVQVDVLAQTVTGEANRLGNVGDRIAVLQFRKKGARGVVRVDVNVTREEIRKPKS